MSKLIAVILALLLLTSCATIELHPSVSPEDCQYWLLTDWRANVWMQAHEYHPGRESAIKHLELCIGVFERLTRGEEVNKEDLGLCISFLRWTRNTHKTDTAHDQWCRTWYDYSIGFLKGYLQVQELENRGVYEKLKRKND